MAEVVEEGCKGWVAEEGLRKLSKLRVLVGEDAVLRLEFADFVGLGCYLALELSDVPCKLISIECGGYT